MIEFKTAGGEILTDEISDELADEAERGYDLSKATKAGRRSEPPASARACKSESTQT